MSNENLALANKDKEVLSTEAEKALEPSYGEKLKPKLAEIIGEASALMAGKKVFDSTKAEELTIRLVNMLDAAQNAERARIMTVMLKESMHQVAQYKALIKHTGSVVMTSMIYAYSKGLNDCFKLVAKGAQSDEKVSEKN